jgi:hypothetical protein
MRFPYHLLSASTVRSEPLLAAIAAIAIGMFAGAWLIGPAITAHDSAAHNSDVPTQPTQERISFDEMISRPDPSPYRAATPAFDFSGAPNYAATAKEKAQAELGGQPSEDEAAAEPASPPRTRGNYQAVDRHRVY